MERRKEERKKELERRRMEREKEKAKKQSSPKRLLDLVIPDAGSEHEEFEPWEDLDETPSSPRSDATVSGKEDMSGHNRLSGMLRMLIRFSPTNVRYFVAYIQKMCNDL